MESINAILSMHQFVYINLFFFFCNKFKMRFSALFTEVAGKRSI